MESKERAVDECHNRPLFLPLFYTGLLREDIRGGRMSVKSMLAVDKGGALSGRAETLQDLLLLDVL